MLKNTQSSYGTIFKLLHWLVAITIFVMFIAGVWMVELSYYDQWYRDAPYYHKSVGILLALLMLFRLFWRWKNVKPVALNSHTKFEKKAAHVTHILIYSLIFSVIISGYLISTADERSISVFGIIEIPSLGSLFDKQEDIAGFFHQWLAYSLMGLALLHITAAIKHHFIDNDATIKRII